MTGVISRTAVIRGTPPPFVSSRRYRLRSAIVKHYATGRATGTVTGGLGSIAGAALGAAVIGFVQAMGTLWLPTWAPAFIFLAMILVLVIRPSGLMGAPARAWSEEE